MHCFGIFKISSLFSFGFEQIVIIIVIINNIKIPVLLVWRHRRHGRKEAMSDLRLVCNCNCLEDTA